MKKLILLSALAFFSCKKEAMKIQEEPVIAQEKTSTTGNIRSVFVYSTTVEPIGDVSIEIVDTTYYEVWKNGKMELSWKSNWNIKNPKCTMDLSSYMSYKSGDDLTWKIIHRSPRDISGYMFAGGITSDSKTLFGAQFPCYFVEKESPYFDPNRKTFVMLLHVVVD